MGESYKYNYTYKYHYTYYTYNYTSRMTYTYKFHPMEESENTVGWSRLRGPQIRGPENQSGLIF